MDRLTKDDILCYRTNYDQEGWKKIGFDHFPSQGAVAAIKALCDEVELLQAEPNKTEEIIRKLLSHVSTSTDMHTVNAVYYPPAMQLRMQADRIEQKDKDIEEAKQFLRTLEQTNKATRNVALDELAKETESLGLEFK